MCENAFSFPKARVHKVSSGRCVVRESLSSPWEVLLVEIAAH